MPIAFFSALALLIWLLLGAICLAAIDDESETVYKWASSGGSFTVWIALLTWPYSLYLWYFWRKG